MAWAFFVKMVQKVREHTTKTDLKNVTHVDTSSFALKTNLTSLKLKLRN